MKKIDYQKLNNGGKRTYNNFMISFYQLLTVKSFDEITVAEFCQFAKYPRATFYNYFDDKYELLECFWNWSFNKSIKIKLNNILGKETLIKQLFDESYATLIEREENLKKTMKNNASSTYFISSLDFFIKRKIEILLTKTDFNKDSLLPKNLLIDHVSSSIFILIKNRFLNSENWNQEETYSYFKYLLNIRW